MKRLIHTLLAAASMLLAGCFEKVYESTDYVLKPLSQALSGDVTVPIEGAVAYAFAADTALWGVASYEDALAGVITLKSDPSQRNTAPYATATPYEGEATSAGWIHMSISKATQMVVLVDPVSHLYAYTQQELPENLPALYVAVTFRPWKGGSSFQDGGSRKWSFYNDFYVAPQYLDCLVEPTVQNAEGEEATPIDSKSVKVYAYAADTTLWRIDSYADALAGIITSKRDPEQQRSEPSFRGYKESGSDRYKVTVSSTPLMFVVVDQSDRIYAYTQLEVDLEGEAPTLPVTFRPWTEAWIMKEEGWIHVDESRAPETDETTNTQRR